MEKISWINRKVHDHATIVGQMKFVKSNMRGLLPLYGREKDRLIEYANRHNILPEELMSIRNQIKIQSEIESSRYWTKLEPIIKRKFASLSRDLSKYSSEEKKVAGSKLISFIKQTNLPIPMVVRIISSMPEFKSLNVNALYYLNKILSIIKNKEIISRKKSQYFEDKLADYLRANYALKFKTELEIKSQKLYNITPDILFDEPIELEVDGRVHTIRWIDAKNYILINVPFMLKSLKKQAEKYIKAFGSGAFVFSHGFDSSIKIPGVVYLDGSFL